MRLWRVMTIPSLNSSPAISFVGVLLDMFGLQVTKAMMGGGNGMFTQTRPDVRRIVPEAKPGVPVVKVVYVVLEAQYQSSLSAAVRNINRLRKQVCILRLSRLSFSPESISVNTSSTPKPTACIWTVYWTLPLCRVVILELNAEQMGSMGPCTAVLNCLVTMFLRALCRHSM